MSEGFPCAPDFPVGFDWINTDQALSLDGELSGHVLVVAMWTSSCVNSQQALTTLRFLEQQFADRPFSVVGVHSAKFTAEQDAAHVRDLVRVHDISHPVVIDEDRKIWRSFACRGWPTIVIIDAQGRVRFKGIGQPDQHRLSLGVEALLQEGEKASALSLSPLEIDEPEELERRGLFRPCGLAIDEDREILWITDTGNHRLIGADLATGEVRSVIGNGHCGFADGGPETVRFFQPRGLAIDEDQLFVADMGNHMVRVVNLGDDEVSTILGTGRQTVDESGGMAGIDQGLNGPAGLWFHDGMLYIAMAGQHQIWAMEVDTTTAFSFAGSGDQGIVDGNIDAASLAQPFALAVHGERLAFVDAATSALRLIDLDGSEVVTLIGKGPFEFGDRDGSLEDAALQCPLDVVYHGDELLVADTFNSKIKRVHGDVIETIAGPDDGLHHPEGLAVRGDTLFIANTAASSILRLNLASGEVDEMTLRGLDDAAVAQDEFQSISLRSRADATVKIYLPLPFGTRLHPEVPVRADVENVDGHPLLIDMHVQPDVLAEMVVISGLSMTDEGEGSFRIRIRGMVCVDEDAVCHRYEWSRVVPVSLDPEAATEVEIEDYGSY